MMPFHQRHTERTELPILSRLGREVPSDMEYNCEYPLSTSPRNTVSSNANDNHILSRLGPRTTDYDSSNHSNIEFSHQRQFHGDNSSAFSRLGPEAHHNDISVSEINSMSFSNNSHDSVHTSHDYHFRSGSQPSRRLDLQVPLVSQASENPPILSRLGEQSLAYHTPEFGTNVTSDGQHSPLPPHHQLHVSARLEPLVEEQRRITADEEQRPATALETPAFSNPKPRTVSSEVYGEYIESPNISHGRARFDVNSVHYNSREPVIDQPDISSWQTRDSMASTSVSLPFSMQDVPTNTGRVFAESSSPKTFDRQSDNFESTGYAKPHDTGINKHDDPLSTSAYDRKFSQDHLVPAEPYQQLINSSRLAASKEDPLEDVLNIARLVVGDEVASHLDPFNTFSNHLLHQLFSACCVMGEYLSKERRKDSNFPVVLDVVCSHFKGFFCGTLKSAHLPANSKILFTKELGHLRPDCGKDIPRWKRCIQEFIALTKTFSSRLLDALPHRDNCCDASDMSLSPQPLVVDEGNEMTSPSFEFECPQDYVGYRPTTEHSRTDEKGVPTIEVSIDSRSSNSVERSGSHSSSSPVDSKRKEEPVNASRHSLESSKRHPASNLGKQDGRRKESPRHSMDSFKGHSESSPGKQAGKKREEPITTASLESSKRHLANSLGKLTRQEPVSTSRHSKQSLKRHPASKPDSKKGGELVSTSRHSVECSKRHPASNLDDNKGEEPISRHSKQSPKRHPASILDDKMGEESVSTRYSVESSKRHPESNWGKQDDKKRGEVFSKSRHSLEHSKGHPASNSGKQDDKKGEELFSTSRQSSEHSKGPPASNLGKQDGKDPVSTSRHSSKPSIRHPASSLIKEDDRRGEEPVSISRQSSEFSNYYSTSSKRTKEVAGASRYVFKSSSDDLTLKQDDKQLVNRHSSESSERQQANSPVIHNNKRREDAGNAIRESSRRHSASSPVKQLKSGVESKPQERITETLQKSNCTISSENVTASQVLAKDAASYDMTLSLPVTSKIPVNSAQRTAEGLQSLLDIVTTGILKKDCYDGLGVSISEHGMNISSGQDEKSTTPFREHPQDTDPKDTSISRKIPFLSQGDQKEPAVESFTTTKQLKDSSQVSSNVADGCLHSNSQKLSDKSQEQQNHLSPKSVPRDKATPIDQSDNRGSLSPGEILSSPSPSPPPPPLSHKSSGHRGVPSQSHRSRQDNVESRSRSRSQSSSKQQSRRPRSRSPARSYLSYRSHMRPGRYGIHTRVNRYRRDRVSPHRSNGRLRGTRCRYVRSSSESEDELELLALRKKAILSMIPESSKKAATVSSSSPSKRLAIVCQF